MNQSNSIIDPHQIIESLNNSLLAIENFDLEKLNEEKQDEMIKELEEAKKIALEIKAKLNSKT